VAALNDPETRENALLDLSKKRDMFADLAPILWHSYGVIPALLQEIVSIYPLLSPPSLTAHASNRVCNALALLQCVASHPDTRALFLNGALLRLRRAPQRHPGACWAQGATRLCPNPALSEPALTRRAAGAAQHTSRSSSTPSSTPCPRRGRLSTCASPAWVSSELSSRCDARPARDGPATPRTPRRAARQAPRCRPPRCIAALRRRSAHTGAFPDSLQTG
jgi:hypothetical protein